MHWPKREMMVIWVRRVSKKRENNQRNTVKLELIGLADELHMKIREKLSILRVICKL